MDFDILRAFVAAVQEGSVSAAGRRLYRSQSAVTRQIQALEAEAGGPLLDRRSRPLAPTPLGRMVLDYARKALAAVDDMKAAAAALGAEPTGELRIAMGLTLAEILRRVPLARFRKTFPRLVLAITSDWSRHLLAGLKDGAFDVGVLLLPTGWTPPESVEARRLVTDELVVIAPRTARLPRRVDPSRLADARWILNPEGCGFRVALRQALATAGHPLNVAIELHGPALQIELVAAGFGFGLVPLRALRVHPRRHLVRAGSISHPQMTIGIWFVVGPVSPSLKPAVDLLEQGVRHALEPRKASPVRAAAPAGVGPGGGAAGSRA